jgi:hypothetical protein
MLERGSQERLHDLECSQHQVQQIASNFQIALQREAENFRSSCDFALGAALRRSWLALGIAFLLGSLGAASGTLWLVRTGATTALSTLNQRAAGNLSDIQTQTRDAQTELKTTQESIASLSQRREAIQTELESAKQSLEEIRRNGNDLEYRSQIAAIWETTTDQGRKVFVAIPGTEPNLELGPRGQRGVEVKTLQQ